MSAVSMKFDFKRVERMLGAGDKAYQRAAVTSLNKSIKKARTHAKRQTAAEAGIKPQKLVYRRMKIKRAKRGKYVAVLSVLTNPVPAIKLSGVRDTRYGDRAKERVRRSRSAFEGTSRRRKALNRLGRGVVASGHNWPHAWIAQGESRTPQVFERQGQTRLPVQVVTIPIKDEAERAIKDGVHKANEYLVSILPGEVMRQLKRATR